MTREGVSCDTVNEEEEVVEGPVGAQAIVRQNGAVSLAIYRREQNERGSIHRRVQESHQRSHKHILDPCRRPGSALPLIFFGLGINAYDSNSPRTHKPDKQGTTE